MAEACSLRYHLLVGAPPQLPLRSVRRLIVVVKFVVVYGVSSRCLPAFLREGMSAIAHALLTGLVTISGAAALFMPEMRFGG